MSENPRIKPIEQATGKSWYEWLAFLNGVGAEELTHKDIASKVFEELGDTIDNPGWWAQGVTVAYEQEIGRRLPGQRADGTFEVAVSKSTQLGMEELMDAWSGFVAKDQEVLDLIGSEPKVTGSDKRMNWRAKAKDGTAIAVTSEPKPNGTASVIATLAKLPTQHAYDEAKQRWASILARFVSGL